MPGRFLAGCLLALSLALPTLGQRASTFHLFPLVADGGVASSGAYRTQFVVKRLDRPATCTLSLQGIDRGRLATTTVVLDSRSTALLSTHGTAAELQTGYAMLSCSDPVSAYATLQQRPPGQAEPSSTATLLPSDTGFRSWVTGISSTRCRCRLAIAVANDEDFSQDYLIFGPETETTRTIAAKSSETFFADEVLGIAPENEIVVLDIVDLGGGRDLHLTALQYVGDTFAAAPPRVVECDSLGCQ